MTEKTPRTFSSAEGSREFFKWGSGTDTPWSMLWGSVRLLALPESVYVLIPSCSLGRPLHPHLPWPLCSAQLCRTHASSLDFCDTTLSHGLPTSLDVPLHDPISVLLLTVPPSQQEGRYWETFSFSPIFFAYSQCPQSLLLPSNSFQA